MGLLDFLKKGVEKPAPDTKKAETTQAPKTPVPPVSQNTTPPVTEQEKTYTVQKGDTLSKISKVFYGDAGKWNKIFQANKNIITNPDLIKPGQILKIPKL